MKIAIIGKGRVGAALAPAFAKAGHQVTYGVRDPSDPKHRGGDDLPLRPTGAAAAWADVVVAAIMWEGVDGLLRDCGDLTGKILVDCINPYDFTGSLASLIGPGQSAGELIAARTSATVVKTLNQVSSVVMASAHDYPVHPLQFVAADDAEAKAMVMDLLRDIGFDARDAGTLAASGDLEAMGRVYIAQMFRQGMPPTTSWALVSASPETSRQD